MTLNFDQLPKEISRQYNFSPVRSSDNPASINLNIPREFNAADYLLKQALENYPDEIAFITKDSMLTFTQLSALVNKAGNFLLSRQIAPERRVVLLIKDPLYFSALFLGAIKIGAVPVAMHYNFREHELRYLLDDSRAAAVIADPEIYLTIKNLCSELPWKTEVIVSSPIKSEKSSMLEELQECDSDLNAVTMTADDSAFWLYTHGTSGFPKAAVHMHRSPLYACRAYAQELLKINKDDLILSMSPIWTNLGVMEKIFFPLACGAASIVTPAESAEKILELIQVHKPSLMFAPPKVYADIIEQSNEFLQHPMGSLRCCISSGGILTLSLQASWKHHFNLDVLNGLSNTEELYIFISNCPDNLKEGSIGRPVPGYSIRLEDKDGLPSAVGSIGDLMVNGGSMAKEFWNKHKKTSKSILGIWLNTGDKALIDEDGYVFFCGKKDDMFFINNQWVSPADVEKLLLELPQISQAAVVSKADLDGTLKLRAYIVLEKDYEPSTETAKEIKIQHNNSQPLQMQIKWIEFVPGLPRAANGKLQRYKLI